MRTAKEISDALVELESLLPLPDKAPREQRDQIAENFKGYQKLFELIRPLGEAKELTEKMKNAFNHLFNRINDTLNHTRSLKADPTGGPSKPEHAGHLRNHLLSAREEIFATIVPDSFEEYWMNLRGAETARKNYERLVEEVSQRSAAVDNMMEQASSVLEVARQGSTLRQLGSFGSEFLNVANRQTKFLWLYGLLFVATLVLTVATIVELPKWLETESVVISRHQDNEVPADNSVSEASIPDNVPVTSQQKASSKASFELSPVTLSITRLGIVALAITLAVFFSRQFSATRHVQMLASHRHTAAKSYAELHNVGFDDKKFEYATLAAVLSVVVQEPPSPFAKSQPNDGTNSADIRELLRLMDSKGSS